MMNERLGARLAERHQEILGENGRLRTRNRDLLAALEKTLPYLPTCSPEDKSDKARNCGAKFPYKPNCLYVETVAAIAAVKGEGA